VLTRRLAMRPFSVFGLRHHDMTTHAGLLADQVMTVWDDTLRLLRRRRRSPSIAASINGFALAAGYRSRDGVRAIPGCQRHPRNSPSPRLRLDHLWPGSGGTQLPCPRPDPARHCLRYPGAGIRSRRPSPPYRPLQSVWPAAEFFVADIALSERIPESLADRNPPQRSMRSFYRRLQSKP